MTEDAEIKAMADVNAALSKLDPEATARVLRWAIDRFGERRSQGPVVTDSRGEAKVEAPGPQVFNDIVELYDAAAPTTEAEKVLVAAYWFQVQNQEPDVDAQGVNSALKNMGHGVSNITNAFSTLMNQQPRLVLQTKKAGTTRQARKRYKLTVEGIRRVRGMLSKPSTDDRDDG